MELNQVSTLKPENTACSIAGSGSGSNYTKIIGLLNDFQQELTQLTDKVNARDEVINTGTINAAKNITSAGTISAKDLTATGTLLIEGVANFTDIVVENDIQVKGSLLVDLFEIGDALINNLEVSTGTINSLISDIIKLKSELKRFDTNQNVISFPSPEETQIGDLANNVILAGLKKPKWNEEHLATEEFTALNYYNKEETEQREADELVDAIHRETDIIMGNTPVQRVAKGCVDTEGHLLATTDDAYMLSGAEGRDNIIARASLDDIKACGMYNVTKVDVANSITEKPTGEEGPFDLTVGYSLADKLKPYQLYVSHTTEKMYIRLSNVDNEFSSWQQFSFVGGSTRPADVGNPIINLKPEYDNEINFYGSNTSPILVFSGHGTNKNVFMFGKNASGELKAKKVMIDGKVACVQDEIKNFAFGTENTPLKAGDDIDKLPLGTYGTVDFSIFSQLLGDKPFNNPFKLFCFKGGVNEAKSKQQLAIEWNSESVALRHTQDGKLWTRWAQVSLKDSNGYVDKAKTADNLNSGAKLDGSLVATQKDIAPLENDITLGKSAITQLRTDVDTNKTGIQNVIDGVTPVTKVSDNATKGGNEIATKQDIFRPFKGILKNINDKSENVLKGGCFEIRPDAENTLFKGYGILQVYSTAWFADNNNDGYEELTYYLANNGSVYTPTRSYKRGFRNGDFSKWEELATTDSTVKLAQGLTEGAQVSIQNTEYLNQEKTIANFALIKNYLFGIASSYSKEYVSPKDFNEFFEIGKFWTRPNAITSNAPLGSSNHDFFIITGFDLNALICIYYSYSDGNFYIKYGSATRKIWHPWEKVLTDLAQTVQAFSAGIEKEI